MKTKHEKTLRAVFSRPTLASIPFADLEALLVAAGGQVREGTGSRVLFEISGARLHLHRPHPGSMAKRYQVEALREFLNSVGIAP